MSARGLLFAGDVYMQPIVGGVLMDRVGPIEGGQFAIKPNADVIDFVSTGRNTWGQILESVGLQKPADLLLNHPLPMTLRQLRGFLEITGYCRIWIPGYGELAWPLYELITETQQAQTDKLVWSPDTRL